MSTKKLPGVFSLHHLMSNLYGLLDQMLLLDKLNLNFYTVEYAILIAISLGMNSDKLLIHVFQVTNFLEK